MQTKGTQDDGGGLRIDEMKSAVKKFLELESRKFQLAKYQGYEFDITMWLAKYAACQKKSPTSKYASDLAEDLQKHKKEVGRISAHMMKLACADAEDLDGGKIPQLLEEIMKCDSRHEELKDWSIKFGLAESAKVSKRKKKA